MSLTPFVPCSAPYVSALVRQGLLLKDGQLEIGGGEVGWTLGAALAEGYRLAGLGVAGSQSAVLRCGVELGVRFIGLTLPLPGPTLLSRSADGGGPCFLSDIDCCSWWLALRLWFCSLPLCCSNSALAASRRHVVAASTS